MLHRDNFFRDGKFRFSLQNGSRNVLILRGNIFTLI